MNITNLKSIDVVHSDNKLPSHTIYMNPDDANVLVIQALTPTTSKDMAEATRVFEKAVDYAMNNGFCVLSISSDFDIKVINLGKKKNNS